MREEIALFQRQEESYGARSERQSDKPTTNGRAPSSAGDANRGDEYRHEQQLE